MEKQPQNEENPGNKHLDVNISGELVANRHKDITKEDIALQEALPAWLGCLTEPYPTIIVEYIKRYGDELNDVVNDIVWHFDNFRQIVSTIDIRNADIDHLLTELEKSDEGTEYRTELGTDLLKKYLDILQQFYMESEDQKGLIGNVIVGFLEDSELRRRGEYQSQNQPYLMGQYSAVPYGGAIFNIIDRIRRIGRVDILYAAPRSAIFPAQIIKGSLDYLSSFEPDKFTKVFVSYPKSKAFTYLSESDISEYVNYLMAPSAERKSVLLGKINAKRSDVKPDGEDITDVQIFESLVQECKSLISNIESKITDGNKEVSVVFFDEAVNSGTTLVQLGYIGQIAEKYTQYKYGEGLTINNESFHLDGSGSYESWPKIFSNHRRDNEGSLLRYSFDENPVAHQISRASMNVAYIIGQHMGFVSHISHELQSLIDRTKV